MGNHHQQIIRVFYLLASITLVQGQLCNNCLNRRGWDGPTCSRRNVALNRTSSQSSTFGVYQSRLAVDGNIEHYFSEEPPTCTHTQENNQSAYWTVTLDAQYNIYRFRIYNRNGDCKGGPCGYRLNGFTLLVGNSSKNYNVCYQDTTTNHSGPGDTINGTCNVGSPIRGDTVKIMTNNTRPLTLCEVQIFVCANGTYGPDCGEGCGNCAEGSSDCDTISGHCPQRIPRCMLGYSPPKCDSECTNNTWGADCMQHCGHCYNNNQCNTTNGDCPAEKGNARCALGYSDSGCSTQCTNNTWGADCMQHCGQCYNNNQCNPTNGDCPAEEGNPRCALGYSGSNCSTQCDDQLWGPDCSQTCGHCYNGIVCNKTSGECPLIQGNFRCAPGYVHTDKTCNTPVNQNYTGVIIGCVAAVVVVAIVIVVILQVRKRRGNSTGRTTDSSNHEHVRNEEISDEGRQATTSTPVENHAYENVSEHEYDKIRFSNCTPESNYTVLG